MNDTDRKPTRMVDVGEKDITFRRAVASGSIRVGRTVRKAIDAGKIPKGNVLEVARVAGIMAAKQTAALLPLCHPLPNSCRSESRRRSLTRNSFPPEKHWRRSLCGSVPRGLSVFRERQSGISFRTDRSLA